ncbi:MAG TPA: hypothetical protein VFH29_07675, partial [Anaerolineales bacterium]|nr:hypothetical protein [Anaerolineales bacterium]
MPEHWEMRYPLQLRADSNAPSYDLRFTVMTTPGRHLGLFPEAAANWDFTAQLIQARGSPTKVLNLFGYTGLATLAAAAAGAAVTH